MTSRASTCSEYRNGITKHGAGSHKGLFKNKFKFTFDIDAPFFNFLFTFSANLKNDHFLICICACPAIQGHVSSNRIEATPIMISTLENVPMLFFTALVLNNFHDPDSGSSRFRIDSGPLFSKSAPSKTYPYTTSAHKRQKKSRGQTTDNRQHTHYTP